MARAPTLSSSESTLSLSSSSSDDLTDRELWAISHQITMGSFVVLGHVLGYSFDEVEEALTACESNTEKASMRLLRRWRNEQPSCKDATKDLLDRLNKAEQRERNVRAYFSGNSALEKTVDAVNKANCDGTDLVSGDYSAQSVSSACKRIAKVNRRKIFFDILPGSGSWIQLIPSMDSIGQREEDPRRNAVAVETNSFSRPCCEVLPDKTDPATTARNSDNGNEQELNALATGKEVRGESSSESGIDFVEGSCKPLSAEEVDNVAEDIESDAQIENLGVALAFSRADINRYLGTNEALGSKTSRGTRMMLLDWRQKVRQRDQRASLKGALVKSGLVMIADQYFPDVQEMAENLCSHSVDEHGSTLRSLARDIESDDQMCALGRELGFSDSVLDRFAASNRNEGMVTCKGNTDMLFEWRQGVVPSELPFRLKKALRQAGLVFLAEKHFPDILQDEEASYEILEQELLQ